MTTNNLFRVMATVLCFTAACKGDFAAGITGSGKDGSARETGALQDGGNPNAQEAAPPSSTGSVSCDPFQPTTKPITLTNVIGVGQDTDGTLYVVDQPQPGGERVFVSSGATLQRQRIAGSGIDGYSYTFSISDHIQPFTLRLDTNTAGPTAMGVLLGTTDGKTFTIGQQGNVLTLVSASQIAAMPVANLPAETIVECDATIPDGRVLLVVRPRDDWTLEDLRVFFGTQGDLIERPVDHVDRLMGGDGTFVYFTIDGVAASATYPLTLTIGTTSFPLTLVLTDSPPAGESYFCLGNPSPDGGADAWVPPADGPSCRAPSPDYGPTSVFPFLPDGTPAATTTCPAACGDSAWPPGFSSFPNIDIALPYGSCAPGTPSCSTGATVPCACAQGTGGPVHGFNCSCEGGTWICGIRTAGGAMCMPCPDAGVSDGLPSGDGASKPDGLNLTGLTAMTLTVTWIPRTSDPPGACHTDTKNVYSLDIQTRVLNWEHCAVDPNTAAAYRKTETQTLTGYEVTAARMLLAFLSTSNRTQCGADADTETLDLTFPDRVQKYQDDFYACNPPLDGRTYIANITWIREWLGQLGQNMNPLPSSFVSLSVTSDLNPFASDTAMTAATAACGDAVYPTYDVTAATKKLSWSTCVSSSTGYKLQTGNRVLSQSEFASVMQSWSAIQPGATGDCSTPRTSKEMVLTTAPNVPSAYYLNDLAACSLSSYNGSMPVVGLDDFSALLVSLAH
jgi:hypothetical protein